MQTVSDPTKSTLAENVESGEKRKRKIHICYDLVGLIPVDVRTKKAEQA